MITEQELKAMCTPDIIKEMVELAEGFELFPNRMLGHIQSPNGALFTLDYNNIMNDFIVFPLLIHRACEGINKKLDIQDQIIIGKFNVECSLYDCKFENYQPENQTQLECALLHCMIEILKEGGSMSEAREEFYSIKSICSMKVVNYVNEIEAENANLKSYNQLKIDSSLKVVQLEEDKTELIKFIEKVEYMIPMSLYPTIKNGATEILRKF